MASDTTPKVNGTRVVKAPLGDVLHIIDSRTRQHYTVDINQNAINATDLKAIKLPKDEEHPEYQNEQGLRVYDPGYSNTLVSESKITYMQVTRRNSRSLELSKYLSTNNTGSDGLEGTIQYRGYSIHDIIGKKKFSDLSYLLIWGSWPTAEEAQKYQERLNNVPLIDESVFNVIRSFP